MRNMPTRESLFAECAHKRIVVCGMCPQENRCVRNVPTREALCAECAHKRIVVCRMCPQENRCVPNVPTRESLCAECAHIFYIKHKHYDSTPMQYKAIFTALQTKKNWYFFLIFCSTRGLWVQVRAA